MNKNALIGLGLVATAAALCAALASSAGAGVCALFGKAAWYLPYGALVAGIGNLALARR